MNERRLTLAGLVFSAALAAAGGSALAQQSSSEGSVPNSAQVTDVSEWLTSPYQNGKVERNGGESLITTTGVPGGYFFRRTIDPRKKYKLAVVGEPVLKKTTLKLRLGNELPQWVSAPNGESDFVVSNVRNIEILFYSDEQFSYRLKGLKLSQCSECVPDSEKVDAASRFAIGWSVALHHQPESVYKDSVLAIGSAGSSAGIYFRKKLEPSKVYRLRVSGKTETGTANLRLKIGQHSPEWLAAPTGEFDRVISNADGVEVLIYAESTFKYQLSALSITECNDCSGVGAEPKLDTAFKHVGADVSKKGGSGDRSPSQDFGHGSAGGIAGNERSSQIEEKSKETEVPGNWQISNYNDAHLETVVTSTTVTGTGKPAGIVYGRVLDPKRRYLVKIEGHPKGGRATLRVRQDAEKPRYMAAPNGSTELVISDTARLELMIYADDAFSYDIEHVSIVFCDKCRSEAETASELRAALPEWQASLFNSPELTSLHPGMLIGSKGGTNGIQLIRRLDPAKTYRLQIVGHQVSGSTVGRIKVGTNDPEWFAAPDRRQEFVILGVSRVEVLLYGEKPYVYSLKSLQVEECPHCPTDSKLREKILSAIPGLAKELDANRFEAALKLLDWTSKIEALGSSIDPRSVSNTNAMPGMTAAQIYDQIWKAEDGGTYCAGFAIFFAKVLNLFDYHAFTINIGYEQTDLTHVTTVVPFRDGNETKFYILDPTLNGYYRDTKTGEPIDIAELLRRDREGQYDSYRFEASSFIRPVFLESRRASRLMQSDASVHCEPIAEGRLSLCRDFHYNLDTLVEGWRNLMVKNHVSFNRDLIVQLFKKRLFGAMAKGAERERFLDLVRKFGIPTGYIAAK
jgi:hypothetical protein